MAKQAEERFTQIPNEELERLMKMHLSPNQWQVLLCIFRKTYGFHKKVDYIANKQIMEATDLGKVAVSRCLKELMGRQLITREGKYIGFQKDWKRWEKLSESATSEEVTTGPELAESATKVDGKSCRNRQPKLAVSSTELPISAIKVSSPDVAQKKKETLTKDTIQKKAKFILPEWIDKTTWEAFLEMRKKKRAIPTERAKELLVKELGKLRGEGNDPNEVLNQSIMRNYTGVFPLKGGQDGAARGHAGARKLPKNYRSPEQIFGEGGKDD